MTHVDDLEVGMWIAMVGHREETVPMGGLFQMTATRKYNGEPALVLAISLPFICVQVNDDRLAIDVRDVQVQQLSDEYVFAMLNWTEKCPVCGAEDKGDDQ